MTHRDTCPECGEPLDDDFGWRADMIMQALDGADTYTEQALLSMFLGMWLSCVDAGDRRAARRDTIKDMDAFTKQFVIQACDA